MATFYPPLLVMAQDPVTNVRLAVARLSHVGWLANCSEGIRQAIQTKMKKRKNIDRDIQFFSQSPTLQENDATHLNYSRWKTRERRWLENHYKHPSAPKLLSTLESLDLMKRCIDNKEIRGSGENPEEEEEEEEGKKMKQVESQIFTLEQELNVISTSDFEPFWEKQVNGMVERLRVSLVEWTRSITPKAVEKGTPKKE